MCTYKSHIKEEVLFVPIHSKNIKTKKKLQEILIESVKRLTNMSEKISNKKTDNNNYYSASKAMPKKTQYLSNTAFYNEEREKADRMASFLSNKILQLSREFSAKSSLESIPMTPPKDSSNPFFFSNESLDKQ